jgi:MarR family 2-MHQ and catechol resistance regulon transcriptional repressor
MDAYRNLVRATESVSLLLVRQMDSFGLTMSQFRVLEMLLHEGPMSQARLSEKLFREESNISVTTTNLVKGGLVARQTNEERRRKVTIRLTSEGQKLISKVYPLHANVVRAQMAALNGREQETLRRLCRTLAGGDPVKFLLEIRKLEVWDEDEPE